MEKKKVDLTAVASGAGIAAAELFGRAKKAVVTAVDQNGDGQLDIADVSILSDSIKAAVKDGGEKWNEKQEQLKREREIKQLCPIFADDLDNTDFSLTKLIRVADMDKKHRESELCIGSVGFESIQKDLKITHIYPDKVDAFGLSFYPDSDCDIYYVDPCDRDHYIALDDYFSYLKVARISELQRIAQDLGAKHFRVTYKEHKKSFSAKDVQAKVSGGRVKGAEANHNVSENDYSKVEIAAEMDCIGHKPVQPTLVYFKNDPQIQNLVSLRLSDNAMTHQTYTLELSRSSGIKIKDAMKIDATLSAMRLEGNATVTSEAQNEARRVFEYEIDF